ncbi:MAG: hypothetical protein V9E90_12960 [Saprospiraceae bacterium]
MQLTENKISNQTQAIQYFIEKMDIEMVDAFLDNDKTYQDFEKYLFISKLQQVFSTFADFGDTHLLTVEGSCNSCDKTKTGFTFIGNNSNNYMSIIFDTTDNKINDLYECSDFKNKQTNLNLKERIYIDNELTLPF